MKTKKRKIFFIAAIIIIISGLVIIKFRAKKPSEEITKEITPVAGSIHTLISTTGSVLPKNRLELKPPVNGRIDSILVKEGDKVKNGQIVAWMSSTERAALLDAARGQGSVEKFQYWEEAYKPIPLIATIDAEVIVATIQSGQTITTNDAVIVLSDHLIVRAQVDETDIGKIRLGQKANVTLDAYPETKIEATVEHIYYESKVVNNVTIYEVDLIPEKVPQSFRSGMNATIAFVERNSENALIIPIEAIHKENDQDYVWVTRSGFGKEPEKRVVKLGISEDKNVEVLSGLSQSDKIIIKTKKFSLPQSATGTNPFTPFRRRR